MPFDIVNPLDDTNWDQSIEKFQLSNVFCTRAWVQTLHESYDYLPLFYRLIENGSPVSIIPLMEIRSWLTGRRGISLPFTDTCTPMYQEKSQLVQLFDWVKKDAEKRSWKSIELRGGDFLAKKPTAQFWSHTLKLNQSEDELFKKLSSSNRRAIRKAQRLKLSIEEQNNKAGLRDFYHLQCLTRRRHGLPPQPFRFFENVLKNLLLEGKGHLLIARQKGRAIAGAIFLIHKHQAVFKYGASDKQFQDSRANNLIMWEAIRKFQKQGLEQLDFGRTGKSEKGLRHYKLGWGTTEEEVNYVRYNVESRSFEPPSEKSQASSVLVFRMMPLVLNRLAGKLLYRHVA